MKTKLYSFIFLCLALCTSPAQSAIVPTIPVPGGFLDVEYYAGTGSKTAYYVIDFGGSPSGGGKVAYGFRFDASNLAGHDGLLAIDSAGSFQWDYSVHPQFGYNVIALGDGTDFDMPDYGDDGRFWNLYTGVASGGTINWTEAQAGISGLDFSGMFVDALADGEIYGFYADTGSFAGGGTFPTAPAAIPEPGTWAVLLTSGVMTVVFARRRRVS